MVTLVDLSSAQWFLELLLYYSNQIQVYLRSSACLCLFEERERDTEREETKKKRERD